MAHREGGRIQELESEIKKELEKLGITRVNFYFGDSENNPRVEYKINSRKDIKCKELKDSLRKIITSNILYVGNICWRYDEIKGVYIGELELAQGFRLDKDLSTQHGLLSLACGELISHRMRYKL